jgi:hypothetical protein
MLCQHNSPEKAIKVSDCIHTFSRHLLTLHPRDNTIAELDCARRTFVEYVSFLTLHGLVISFVADLSVTKMIISVFSARPADSGMLKVLLRRRRVLFQR